MLNTIETLTQRLGLILGMVIAIALTAGAMIAITMTA